MTEHQALHPDENDLEDNFLKNNSRKKTYAEAIQANIMDDSSCEEAEDELENHSETEWNTNQQTPRADIHLDSEGQDVETWEIQITPELKSQLAGPWKTSIILKLMG